MHFLVIQYRHHLKNFQRACLKHTMIYTRLSPCKPLSQIPTANFPLNSVAELAPIKNTTRTVASSVSPPKDMFGRPQSSNDASMSPPGQKRDIINPDLPATQFGIIAGVFLRHKAQSLGFRVLPDGNVRVSEILDRNYQFKGLTFDEFEHFVKKDPMDRFEMTFQYDLTTHGDLEKVWWVRARFGHTIPGVHFATRRIVHVGKLGAVYYITRASNWEHIREHGITPGPDYLIQLYNISPFNNYSYDRVPVHTKALRIFIDPKKAVAVGVKFFHTKDVQLIASGDRDYAIPLNAFKNVAEIGFTKETLKRTPATRTEQKAEDSASALPCLS